MKKKSRKDSLKQYGRMEIVGINGAKQVEGKNWIAYKLCQITGTIISFNKLILTNFDDWIV